MTTGEREQGREIGQLIGRVEAIANQIERDREDFAKTAQLLFDKFDQIHRLGCARHDDVVNRIEKLEGRPDKLINWGAAIVSIGSAVAAAVLWVVGVKR